jgi:hypothetical protein
LTSNYADFDSTGSKLTISNAADETVSVAKAGASALAAPRLNLHESRCGYAFCDFRERLPVPGWD